MKKLLFIALMSWMGYAPIWAQNTSYEDQLAQIQKRKSTLQSLPCSPETLAQISSSISSALTQFIFPAWYNTPWDFNGISNVPGEGQIACGYFVSTTLKHAGFNLNRYKLAQQAASVIVKSICGSSTWFTSKEALIQHLKAQPDGIYVLGLDYHVGFLVVQQGVVDFVHSDYFNGKVVREPALKSAAFCATENYVIGALSNNKHVIANWLNGTKVY